MPKQPIDELLIKSVLDFEFRTRLQNDPQSVMGDFDLTEEQRDIISNPDDRLLKLIGETFLNQHTDTSPRTNAPPVDRPSQKTSPKADATDQAHRLPDVDLLLRLIPYAVESPAGDQRQYTVTYSAHIDWLMQGTRPEDIPLPEIDQPGNKLEPLSLVLRVAPTALANSESFSIQYSFNVESLENPKTAIAPPTSPWNHDTDSDTAKDAAQAVLEAPPENRRDRLVDLVQIVTEGTAQ